MSLAGVSEVGVGGNRGGLRRWANHSHSAAAERNAPRAEAAARAERRSRSELGARGEQPSSRAGASSGRTSQGGTGSPEMGGRVRCRDPWLAWEGGWR